MKCEYCGSEIPEGSLYCAKCGKDVHIVPDFKEFAERKAENTVKNLLNDFDDEEADFGRSPEGANDDTPLRSTEVMQKKRPGTWWIRFSLLAAAVVLLASVSLGFINRSSRTDFLLETAQEAARVGNISKAEAILESIRPGNSEDINALIFLARLYKDEGNMVKYENLLLSMINLSFATSEQNATAYEMLLAIYLEAEDYVSMADILLTCNNVEIRDKYVEYCIMNPEFSLEPGYYGTDQILKITVPGTAGIFYTVDGSEPDEGSFEYQLPLLLTKGEYHIKVRTVNSYGIWSPVAEANYVIESEELYETIEPSEETEPEILPDDHSIFDMGNNLYLVDGVPCVVDANGLFVQLGADIDGVPYIYNVYGELVPLDLDGIPGLREFYEEHLSPGVTEGIQEDAGSGEQGDAPATEKTEDTAEISDTEEGIDE